ncbi:hypothetical protein [Burkholderia cepacia]|uniref:hypothetical protein n=1 Tax=Burkholderia cepacia TaxID=292 RepID=UPI000A886FEA|nr:hypothetical protein [Burkholderia cepacia]MBY4711668.1 hypothetical protein [Burkholderia cepacia]MBY4741824.1 hypothetical protein [Burkholderia cepacia]MBY4745625.1 hypothetical protein [Burkholderia cepacia]MBY4760252.1 hypothetical protein [Burkholderia cepacia]MBY4777168.1 hypothetical protein [Burkholderia cepacia]
MVLGVGFALIGFGLAFAGGFASRAHNLKIKPFDNSDKKVRDSYKPNECDDENNSK